MPLIDGGWRTILDINFANQTSQTLSPDGAYTIAGFTANKTNSSTDRVAMAIVNGSGLVLQPNAGGSDIFGGTFSATCLAFPLNQFIQITPGTVFRLWMYVASDNLSADFDQIDIGFGTTSAADFNITSKMESTGTANQHRWRISNNQASGNLTNSTTQPNRSFTDNVLVTVINSVPHFQTYSLSGTYTNGNWPAFTTLNPLHSAVASTNYNANWSTSTNPTNWNVFIASGRVNSGTTLTCTVGRIRVDVTNNP